MTLVTNFIVCTLRNPDPRVMGKLSQTDNEGVRNILWMLNSARNRKAPAILYVSLDQSLTSISPGGLYGLA